MKELDKKQLEDLYLVDHKNPYEIGSLLNCNHKTIRKYLRLYNIPLRNASEYNYICRKSHIDPDRSLLFTPLSISAHIAYLCEGWHTNKSSHFYFCNTDPNLIDIIIKLLNDIYEVKTMRIQILSNNIDDASLLLQLYPQAKLYIDQQRKTPIVRVLSGGKNLVRDVVKNAYIILSSLS